MYEAASMPGHLKVEDNLPVPCPFFHDKAHCRKMDPSFERCAVHGAGLRPKGYQLGPVRRPELQRNSRGQAGQRKQVLQQTTVLRQRLTACYPLVEGPSTKMRWSFCAATETAGIVSIQGVHSLGQLAGWYSFLQAGLAALAHQHCQASLHHRAHRAAGSAVHLQG